MTHTILIADDEPNILVSLDYLLRREGYVVLLARDGPEALALARSAQPALILLDVMMPGLSGFDVCQALRAEPALRAIRILLLTAKGRDIDVAKGLGLGADGYITKPFSTRDLVQRVRDLLATPT
jgi:DNA-binding response OmpR family regulator